MAVLRSIFIWTAVALITLLLFGALLPSALVAWPFDRKRNIPHWFARTWARALMKANPACRVDVQGAENLDKIGGSGAAVICANHESMADIIALYYLGYPFKWIAKQSLFFVPLIGWAMWMAGYIPLRRGEKDSIRRCMAAAADWIGRGVSIMMFPEGTRSFDGRVKGFKDGAFRLSVDSRVPIVPVALEGPRHLLTKGSWKFAPRARLLVRVGEPIRPRGDGPGEVDRLKSETRQWILHAMAEMKGVTIAEIDAAPSSPSPHPEPAMRAAGAPATAGGPTRNSAAG